MKHVFIELPHMLGILLEAVYTEVKLSAEGKIG